MSNYVEQAQDLEKKAEKKLTGWGLFGNKHEDAADLYDKAANYYKLAKSWDQAGAVYEKLASCHLKLDSKHEAANAYTEAGHAYKKTSIKDATNCLEQSVNCFLEIGRLSMAARYCKEIAEIYEGDQNLDLAIFWYEKAADLFQSEEVSTSANQCRQKIAQYSAQLEQYPAAIEIYEDIARHSLNSTLLKYGVKGHLLNAGICHLCKGDTVSITNALDKYQDMDPTFTGTREYRLLSDLASAIDEQDIGKFTDVLKEFDSMTPLDAWKTTLLLRVKDKLKAQDNDDDDLT
ncbi:hypothetical protein RND81_10G156900 [Saponaria officinalis]|uniref:Alpha-soluble NSF attachment protein n=1 Tax=Saponaria officinalis TaxID=3572 RepID=A0AAW1I2R3_SAPOF